MYFNVVNVLNYEMMNEVLINLIVIFFINDEIR